MNLDVRAIEVLIIITVVFISAVACAFFCSQLAEKKGYSPAWAIPAGFFFGILALIYYAGLPMKDPKT